MYGATIKISIETGFRNIKKSVNTYFAFGH
jgi:hypothetical protein